MLQTMMVPLDGSALAEQALPLALSIAQRANARLVLVQAVPVPTDPLEVEPAWFSIDEQVELLRQEAQSYLQRIRDLLLLAPVPRADRPPPIEIAIRTIVGTPGPALADYAAQIEADLVVMATHGRTGLGRWALGSVADKLIQLSTVPLLLLRPGTETPIEFTDPPTVSRLLLPLDGSWLSATAIPLANEMAQLFDAEVILFRAATLPPLAYASPDLALLQVDLWEAARQDASNYLSAVRETLTTEGVRARALIAEDNVVAALLTAAIAEAVDLIVMTTHGRTGLNRTVFGSVADRVVRSGQCPVLLFRPGRP